MKYVFYLYSLFILLEIIKAKKNITIPFQIQNYNINVNNEKGNIIDNYLYKDISVNLSIGNPPQFIQLSPCLGEYTTFIISKDAKGYEGGIYNKNNSFSYKSLFINEEPEFYIFQTFSEGIKSSENLIFGKDSIEVNNLEFILATEIGGNNCYNPYCEVLTQPGILGFEVSQVPYQIQENVTNTNFISQLKKNDLISDYYFYFHFNTETKGNIIIGIKPDEYNNTNYKNKEFFHVKAFVSSNKYLDWSILFDSISYGETKMIERPIIFRIEFGLIIGYYEWEKVLKNEFFDKLIEEKKCFRNYIHELGNTAYFYYCNDSKDISKFQSFDFYINKDNFKFTLTKDDLFIKVGDKFFFLMIFGGFNDLFFGYPFLKKYQLVFNQDSKTIGYYKDINIDKSSNIVYYIIIIILGIILLALIIIGINIYIKNKIKKKNATELSDEENGKNNKNNNLINDEDLIN